MFCKNCGKEIDDKAAICIHCGVPVASAEAKGSNASEGENNVLAIVGFILSFFISIAGLVCSIIGYKHAPQYGGKGKGLALAGIIISAVSMAIVFIYVLLLLIGLAAVL